MPTSSSDLLAATIRRVRLEAPSRQDPAHPLSASTVGTVRERPACPQKLRLPGIQQSLGSLSKGSLGGKAEDGPESFHQDDAPHLGMVSTESAPPDRRAARVPRSPASWARWLLRSHRQHARPRSPALRGHDGLATVAQSSLSHSRHELGSLSRTPEAVPTPATKTVPGGVPRVANPYLEEPDALIAHVRICGSPGRVTAQGHPAHVALSDAGSKQCVMLRPDPR